MARNKQIQSLSRDEARKIIEQDLTAFLDSGKMIQKIKTGVSGQDPLASQSRKQIVIGKRSQAS
jgi:hypothetical protein